MTEQARLRAIQMLDSLWNRVKRAAKRATKERGKSVSASQYVREAVEQKLEDDNG